MFIPEMTCSLTVSNGLGRISLINLKYCLLLKYASDQLELSISVLLVLVRCFCFITIKHKQGYTTYTRSIKKASAIFLFGFYSYLFHRVQL